MTLQAWDWYARRLGQMSAAEVGHRVEDRVRQCLWRGYRARIGQNLSIPPVRSPSFCAALPAPAAEIVPGEAVAPVLEAADALLQGRWQILGLARKDLEDPDWFFDPVTGRRAPEHQYCFSVNHRSEEVTGNVKQIWELSRGQHVTVLALAYSLSGSDDYAEAAAGQLRSWWVNNPFLSGINWTSGIEMGIRLISWAWCRRLLDGWTGATSLFEGNDLARAQIGWHQRYLAAFRSRGSSANNHVVAESAGQLIGCLAFPWFDQSPAWEQDARRLLERELAANTFRDGLNREMAFEYHGFVAELALAAAVEADRAGRPLSDGTWTILASIADAIASTLDERCRAPRYGDGDDGLGYLLGPPGTNRWASLLAACRALVGAPEWWPAVAPDSSSSLMVALGRPHPVPERPAARAAELPDAGVSILRTHPDQGPEIWCRCDGGPHGYLSIAAHAHADALSVEVRHGGVDILADPGTYCYHGDPDWRHYFRSTLAHNTIEIDGRDQSDPGGSFMWTRHATTRRCGLEPVGPGSTRWAAEHDGYRTRDRPVRHRRQVDLHEVGRRLQITDDLWSHGSHLARVAFHLGPEVTAHQDGTALLLTWTGPDGSPAQALLDLPVEAAWSTYCGSNEPILGWYAPRFGQKVPTTSLIGELAFRGHVELTTTIRFEP